MSKYTGKKVTVNRSAEEIVERFSDMTRLQEIIDMAPEAERAKLGNVSFTTDSVVIDTAQAGKIELKVMEPSPEQMKFVAVGTPVPLELLVDMAPVGESATEMTASIDVNIPMMLRPLVGPQLQKAVDMLTDVIAKISGK